MKRYSLPDARMHRVVESPDGEWVRYEKARLELWLIGYQAAAGDFITEDRRLRQVIKDQEVAIAAAREEGRRVGMQDAAEIIRTFYESGK